MQCKKNANSPEKKFVRTRSLFAKIEIWIFTNFTMFNKRKPVRVALRSLNATCRSNEFEFLKFTYILNFLPLSKMTLMSLDFFEFLLF